MSGKIIVHGLNLISGYTTAELYVNSVKVSCVSHGETVELPINGQCSFVAKRGSDRTRRLVVKDGTEVEIQLRYSRVLTLESDIISVSRVEEKI